MKKILTFVTMLLISTFTWASYPPSSYEVTTTYPDGDGVPFNTLTKWKGSESVIDMTTDPILNSIHKIGSYAFFNKSTLQTITLGASTKELDLGAFQGCSNLTTVNLNPNLMHIWQNAFRECSNLLTITLGADVQTVGKEVFFNCNKLVSVNVNSQNTFYKSIDGVLYTSDGTVLVEYPSDRPGTEYVIENSVTTIANGALDGCVSLGTLTIGPNVTTIGEYATERCWSLFTVNSYANNPPVLGVNAIFPQQKEWLTLHVPIGRKAYYEQSNWANVTGKPIVDDLITTSNVVNSLYNPQISTSSKSIHLENLEPGNKIEVFNLSGVLLHREYAINDKTTIPLQSEGVYLVKFPYGKYAKILVK